MGRSPRFCFSIKACACASPDGGDDSTPLESKSSPEKRRWNLRKKSVGQHVPSKPVITEPLGIFSKVQYEESTSDVLNTEKAPSDPAGKSYIVEQTSSTLLSPVVSSKVSKELTNTASDGVDYSTPEHIVVIQTSIRRCLAKKEIQKLKNVVKLQAVARGYLVRRQAAGTLRCIQAIVKMQALVRARYSVQLTGITEKKTTDGHIPADVGKQSDMEQNKTPAIRNLVSSAFARRLLESTPKTNPIHIMCDPLRPDSAWYWLERWMALTSTSQQNLVFNQDDLSKDMKADLAAYDADDVRLHSIPGHASSYSELTANSQVPEFEGNLITNISNGVEPSIPVCTLDQSITFIVQESVIMENLKYQSKEGSDYFSNQMQQPLGVSLPFELDSNPNKHGFTEDGFKNNGKKEHREAPRIEVNAVNGSRKFMNPAFAAVQAKFEELSSSPASNRYSDNGSRDVISIPKLAYSVVNSSSNEVNVTSSVHSKVDNKLKKADLIEKRKIPNHEGQAAASDYDTEISSSSPDSPDAAIPKIVPKIRSVDETKLGVKSAADVSLKFTEIRTETEKNGAASVDYVEAMQVQKQPAEKTISSIQILEEGTEATNVHMRSQNESPRSYTDCTYSPMTPSSLISLHLRTAKAENSISARKKRSQLAMKNPPSPKSDSGTRSSGEHLWKGAKVVKRPSSSGNDRANSVRHDDSNSSSSSLPNYMQLTVSAKAKINTSFSQRPNIGLHHEDNYLKKRHSLPLGIEKQGLSSRVQNSASETSHALNGVSSNNSTERRWQI